MGQMCTICCNNSLNQGSLRSGTEAVGYRDVLYLASFERNEEQFAPTCTNCCRSSKRDISSKGSHSCLDKSPREGDPIWGQV